MDAKKQYMTWMSEDCFDEETKAELKAIENDEEEIKDRFYRDLEFGTAGLRGILGAGSNRMNKYTVRKATQGLCDYIISQNAAERGVAISYDSRHFSVEFADEAALTLAANGIKAYVFPSLRPTPVLSFAVRKLNCIAGINITASHNPPAYNGYKVYWEDGAQITPPHDKGIIEKVNSITDYSVPKTMDINEAKSKGLYNVIGKDLDDIYEETVLNLVTDKESIEKYADSIKIVYSPLHGTGNIPVRHILEKLGFKHVYVVKEQELPDGDFPTVSYPNPETAEAFELGLKLANEINADIVLATDPDADRLGVHVKDAQGNFHPLNGNMSGCLIGDYLISQIKNKNGSLPKDGAFIKSIVSTRLCDAIARDHGIKLVEVLTGFKYIGQKMLEYETEHNGTYLFGMEESYGCLPGDYARDKDAVAATVILCEAVAHYKALGKTLWEAMTDLYDRVGYFAEGVQTAEFSGAEGAEKMKGIMASLREDPYSKIGEYRVLALRDYLSDTRLNMDNCDTEPIGLPKSDVLYYELSEDAWVCVRPSGTEPKMKFYFGVSGKDRETVENRASAMNNELSKIIATFK